MTASQVPQAKAPITTFWEGEIVGCGGHRFHSAQARSLLPCRTRTFLEQECSQTTVRY